MSNPLFPERYETSVSRIDDQLCIIQKDPDDEQRIYIDIADVHVLIAELTRLIKPAPFRIG